MYDELHRRAVHRTRILRALLLTTACCVFTLLGVTMWSGHSLATAVKTKPTPTLTPTASASVTTKLTPSPSSNLQQELQIKLLQQETSSEAKFQPYIPLISAAVATIAVGVGIFQYRNTRRRDYALRVEQEFATNLSYLVEYPKEDNRSNARAATALDNLKWLVDRTREPDRYRKRVTEAIIVESRDDIDFDDPRQARFDPLCLLSWPPYGKSLCEEPELQGFILYRYQQALRTLKDKDPSYFASIRLAEDGSYKVDRYTQESWYLHFQVLVDGFKRHIELIKDSERQTKAVDQFAEALGNRALADELFRKEESGEQKGTS